MELIENQNTEKQVSTSTENSNSLLIHLSSLSYILFPFAFISIIMPLILWQTMKNDSEYINHHGKEAVNFNLSMILYNILIFLLLGGSLLGVIFSGMQVESGNASEIASILLSSGGLITALVLMSLLSILKIIFVIIAAIRANDGKLYKYPMTIRFIK